MLPSKHRFYYILFLVSFAWLFWCGDGATAAMSSRNRKRKGGRDLDIESFWNGIKIIMILLGVVFLAPLMYFLYTAAKDPLTPTLIVDAWNALKERTLGNLSKPKTKSS